MLENEQVLVESKALGNKEVIDNGLLNEGVKKIVVYDESTKKELAVISKETVTTASENIVIKASLEKSFSDTTDTKEYESQSVNSWGDIYKVLCAHVELLAEHSKFCEPDELIKIIDCLTNILHKL